MTQSPDSFVIAANSDGLPNQDYIILGGDSFNGQSPGRAVVKGLTKVQGWDVQKGAALDGATVIPTGEELARFTVTITVWEGSQYDDWKDFSATYLTKAAVVAPGTRTTRALSIVHPVINDPPFGITEVVVESVVALEEDEAGMYSFEIHFLEYRKPKPAPGKTAAALPTAPTPQPTAKDKTIAANRQKLAAWVDHMAPPVPPE